jgi:hypothetical protein
MLFKVSKNQNKNIVSDDEMMKTDHVPQHMSPFNTQALHRDIPEQAFDFARERRRPKKQLLFVSVEGQ